VKTVIWFRSVLTIKIALKTGLDVLMRHTVKIKEFRNIPLRILIIVTSDPRPPVIIFSFDCLEKGGEGLISVKIETPKISMHMRGGFDYLIRIRRVFKNKNPVRRYIRVQ